jgi:hypothetical protein
MRTRRPDTDAFQALRRANPFPEDSDLDSTPCQTSDFATRRDSGHTLRVLLMTGGSVAAAFLGFVLTTSLRGDHAPNMTPVGCQIHNTQTLSNDGVVCISSRA